MQLESNEIAQIVEALMRKEDIVRELVENWGFNRNSFYNSSTNKHVEKFWTVNRCAKYLLKMERDYTYDALTKTRTLKNQLV